ncbi:MAG: xanthine dehydrogenase family protein molybdopterin-binding subunit [Pseudomonadota bacterium]
MSESLEQHGRVRIGESVLRVEDDRFLRGAGQYIDDLTPTNVAHAALLRSPMAHAKITHLDVAGARSAPGVLLIVTGAEWVACGYGPIPTKCAIRTLRDGSPIRIPDRHCLAVDDVHHAGEPIVLVVAETKAQALDALEMIEIDFEELPTVVEQKTARGHGEAVLWDIAPDNICLDYELGDRDGVAAALENADQVITLEMRNSRVTAVAMEPRGCVGMYEPANDSYTLWNSSQNIHANRDVFAEQILCVPKDKLRHVAPDVGGGFGVKNALYAEPALLLHASRLLDGRPVKWVGDRSESFLSDVHGRDQVSTVTLALDADGTFQALKVANIGNVGAWCGTMGPFTPTAGSARTQGGPYAFPVLYYSAEAVFTNTSQTDPYRGAGRPEASFHIERVIDFAARKLGLDRIELRRKNLIPTDALPWKTSMGLSIDSGNFPVVFDQALQLADYAGFSERAAQARARGRRRGFGLAPYLECTGGAPKEEAKVTFDTDGTVTLDVGSHSTGMGHETAHAQILSDQLGIALDRIRFRQADTALTETGGGHGGSRGMEVGGNAVLAAAEQAATHLRTLAAHLLNSTPNDIELVDTSARDTKTGQAVSLAELATAASDPSRLPPGGESGFLNAHATFAREIITIPNGVHAAEVEIDPDTGVVEVIGFWAIDDFGKIINPMTCDGQVMGGIAQGIGQALLEEVVYDPDSGQLLTGSLMDYCLPRADDMPPMDVRYYEDAPTHRNPLGVKGAGEAGCCGATPAVVNAVLDALSEWDVDHIDMPLTPEKIWRAVHGT